MTAEEKKKIKEAGFLNLQGKVQTSYENNASYKLQEVSKVYDRFGDLVSRDYENNEVEKEDGTRKQGVWMNLFFHQADEAHWIDVEVLKELCTKAEKLDAYFDVLKEGENEWSMPKDGIMIGMKKGKLFIAK